MSRAEARLAELACLLASPTADSLEQAVALAEELAADAQELGRPEAAPSLQVSRELARQARDHFRRLKALFEARAGCYAADGSLRAPQEGRWKVEG